MKKIITILLFAFTLVSLNAEELFNKELSNANTKKGVWAWNQDGVLIASEDEVIWTDKKWENFVLELEYKTKKGGNSGVVIYCTDTKSWINNSVEIQISEKCEVGNFSTSTSIYGYQASSKDAQKPTGQWNKMKVICNGQSVKVFVNGLLVNDWDMSKFTSNQTDPNGKAFIVGWTKIPPKSEHPTVGYIGLQGKHGKKDKNVDNVIEYRNLTVTPINK